jgi:hypothetical protein
MPLFSYNVEPALEEGMKTLLTNNSVNASPSRTADELATPYVTVAFELGAERLVDVPANGGGVSNQYDGQFRFSIVTDRDNNNGDHSTLRATVRQVIAESTAAQYAAAIGSRFAILSIRHAATAYDILSAEDGLDISAMLYEAVIELRQA